MTDCIHIRRGRGARWDEEMREMIQMSLDVMLLINFGTPWGSFMSDHDALQTFDKFQMGS